MDRRAGVAPTVSATMRAERGQTAAEYLGVLLLVGAIVVAMLSAGTGTAVAGGIKDAICSIMQQDDCDAPRRRGDPGVGDSDLDGPSLTDHPLIVLPFPGSVTVSCTYDERDPEKCVPHGGPGVSVQASGELKVERTPTSLDANGCPWQNLSLQTKLQLSANAEAKGAKAGGSLSGYLGQSTTYQVTVAPDQADAIADGDRPPPNPVDPTTLKAGESVQLSEDFYAGINAKGSYRALQLELGYDEGHRVSSGVKRISPTTVRVMVGDSRLRPQRAQARRRLQGRRGLAGQQQGPRRRQAACGRHRHLQPGGLGRLPGVPGLGQAAQGGRARHAEPDQGRDRRLHRRHVAGGQARRPQAGRARQRLRGPLHRDPQRRRHDRHDRLRPLRRRRHRGHDQQGRGRQRRRHADALAAARGRRRLLRQGHLRAHGQDAAVGRGRQPAAGLHRGRARAAAPDRADPARREDRA